MDKEEASSIAIRLDRLTMASKVKSSTQQQSGLSGVRPTEDAKKSTGFKDIQSKPSTSRGLNDETVSSLRSFVLNPRNVDGDKNNGNTNGAQGNANRNERRASQATSHATKKYVTNNGNNEKGGKPFPSSKNNGNYHRNMQAFDQNPKSDQYKTRPNGNRNQNKQNNDFGLERKPNGVDGNRNRRRATISQTVVAQNDIDNNVGSWRRPRKSSTGSDATISQTVAQNDIDNNVGSWRRPRKSSTASENDKTNANTKRQQFGGTGTDQGAHSSFRNVQNKEQPNGNRNQRSNQGNVRNVENENRRGKDTFFGYKKFENYLSKEVDSVILSLHSDIDAFEKFLLTEKAYETNLFHLVLTVLSEKIFCDEANLTDYQNNFVRVLASAEIMNKFRDKCLTLEGSKFKFMYNITDFMVRRMPVSAADSLAGLVPFCVASLSIKDDRESMALLEKFKELLKSFKKKRQYEEVEEKARKAPARGKFSEYDLKFFDKLTPPDNFRNITIIPSVEELLSKEPSFLRPNKQSGSYVDAEHYLDVQFRLLREDFLQPLKQGIQEFLIMRQTTEKPRMPKGSPIRLYYNVECITADVRNEDLHYWIQLNSDCAKINWEKSRRLLPGNLVMLTKNSPSFDSVVFATVGYRKDEDLKKHRKLTIIPENLKSPASFDVLHDNTDLLLIESEIYWESFRHVLKTVQNLNLHDFPLAKYIVRACTDVEPPPSLVDPDGIDATQITLLNRYVDPLISVTWPTPHMLGFDLNQFDAFKAALTKQFVIIQGPPGTGKTYVGLRIAEVILQNPALRTITNNRLAELGFRSTYRVPLLCICYTNHALDQFLEGILKIMNDHDMEPKLVRIGGRSKSEILSQFNLRDVARRTPRLGDKLHWREFKEIESQIREHARLVQFYRQIIEELERPTGIVKFDKFDKSGENVYQTLCFEFSGQLIDKLNSPSFFKMAQKDICNIKKGSALDIVKKWFVFLKVEKNKKRKKSKKDQETQELQPNVEEMEEEFYEALMEHRIISEDYYDVNAEIKYRVENDDSVAGYHVENMSTRQSRFLLQGYHNVLQSCATNDNDTLNVVYAKRQKEANIRENETVERNRLDILSEIFRCLNQKIVEIPDVTQNLEALKRFCIMDPNNGVDKALSSIPQRYAAYLLVAKRAKQLINEIIKSLEEKMVKKARIISQLRRQHDLQILRDANVVGMTTTGAAKFNELLIGMRSRIVIVEEAAEVLEAHIVTSVTKYTDHLILIGDHKQLKPSVAVYDLSRKYDLDVSLFERMVSNDMTCYSLLAQHRMRKEIADLIRTSIYENLTDAPNVDTYENIAGMTKNLFFFTHKNFEKSEGDTLSKLNEFEANFLVGLAGYLLKQGYDPSSITVLTTYTGQMFLLKSKFRNLPSLQPIHVTCVDNFQGEENDIILLSLVRSNAEGRMGFLNISNRVCVALSRAKKGLYIVGNMGMLCKDAVWSQINSKLEKRAEIGTVMKVICYPHKRQTEISNGEDFIRKCPDGGCSKACGLLLNCSHYCVRFCHSQDLDHKEYKCRERCRKPCLSKEAHPCSRECHHGKVCLPCEVRVEKLRSCGHNITVNCHNSADDGFCKTLVKRSLKCEHEVDVYCSEVMDNYLCRVILDKVLACGHESKLMCHSDPNQYQCKIEVKKKLPCTHYRNMKCFEEPDSSKCKIFVEKDLPCGHKETIECRFDAKQAICTVKVPVTLDCGHTLEAPCFRKTKGGVICIELCEERLSCGHACTLKCHYNKDRHHLKYRCKKLCAKTCPEGHLCRNNHECSTQCRKCQEVVKRELPGCSHIGAMKCFESVEKYSCREICGKLLQCGHFCKKKCSEACVPCQEMTAKQTPFCGHYQQVQCNEEPVPENCKEEIKIPRSVCGHRISVACNKRNASRYEIQSYCTEPCNFMFPNDNNGCGHKCSGTCGTCLMGSLHEKCKEKCLRPLICGHLCNFPCSKNCPPCVEKCQMKCEHSKCKMMCGDDCFICKEKCTWRCKHKRCTKLCGEMCNRGPCHEPCDKRLDCGHMCIGFCGEVCPPLCRVCNMDKITEFQLLYTEDEEDARFVWLPDCNHTIEVEGLTMHFNASDESGVIGLKKCPRCTTVVTTLSGRFGNIIRKTFQDVAAVKKTFFGSREQNLRFLEEIEDNLRVEEVNLTKYLPLVKKFFDSILYFDHKYDTEEYHPKLRMVDIHTLKSLQQIWIWVKEILRNLNQFTDETIRRNCDLIFSNIANRQLPLCDFEVNNITNEIQRLAHKIQFYHRWNSASHGRRERAESKALYDQILANLTYKYYDEKIQRAVVDGIKNLEQNLKTGIGISEGERMEIVKAMNMQNGHWFKCPNGHFYAIGECGGAMEIGKCNECGAAIGGGSHSLLASNQFGGEMDGATRPAWDNVMIPQNFAL